MNRAVAVSRRPGRSRLTLAILVLISITALTLDARGSTVIETIRDTALDVVAPVRSGAEAIGRPIANAWNGITRYDKLEKENAELRKELEAARGDTLSAFDAEQQRKELLELLSLDFVGDTPTVAARVLTGSPSNFDQTIELNRGSAQGIRVGMPVVSGAGLVGRIVRVSRSTSVVRLITDPTFAAAASLPVSRDNGLAKGDGSDHPLSIDLIDPKSAVAVGDPVVTGGSDKSLFPPGIPLGTVRSVSKSAGALQLSVEVDPSADVHHLDFVKVLLYQAAG